MRNVFTAFLMDSHGIMFFIFLTICLFSKSHCLYDCTNGHAWAWLADGLWFCHDSSHPYLAAKLPPIYPSVTCWYAKKMQISNIQYIACPLHINAWCMEVYHISSLYGIYPIYIYIPLYIEDIPLNFFVFHPFPAPAGPPWFDRGAMLLFAGLAVVRRLADANAHVVAPAAVWSVALAKGGVKFAGIWWEKQVFDINQ